MSKNKMILPANEQFLGKSLVRLDLRFYDEYIEHSAIGVLRHFEECPNYKNSKSELKSLIGSIPNEKPAFEKAIREHNNGKKDALDIFCLRYGFVRPAPLLILVDHFLRAVGSIIWSGISWKGSDIDLTLKWYAENFCCQNKFSELMLIRECMDFANALVNAQNRLERIFLDLSHSDAAPETISIPMESLHTWIKLENAQDMELKSYISILNKIYEKEDLEKKIEELRKMNTKNQEMKSYYRGTIQWIFLNFAQKTNDDELKQIKKSFTKIRNYRNAWDHGQPGKIITDLRKSIPDIIKTFESILLQYDGLYLWYIGNKIFD